MMNQGYVKDLTEGEIKDLQREADLVFVETLITGFFEIKVKSPTEMFPTDVFYTRETIGEYLMSKFKLNILIESNDGMFLYQPNRLNIVKGERNISITEK